MADETRRQHKVDVEDLVAQTDTGARAATGSVGLLMAVVAFIWSLFQIYIASDLPFMFTDVRSGKGLPDVADWIAHKVDQKRLALAV